MITLENIHMQAFTHPLQHNQKAHVNHTPSSHHTQHFFHTMIKNAAITKIASMMAIATMSSAIMLPNIANAKTLKPYQADYKFTIDNKYKGKATRKLVKTGNQWQYDVSARVAGVATAKQHSQFTISGSKVSPSTARTTYKVFGIGRTHQLKFSKGQVSSTFKGKTHTLSMKKQAHDDLSLETQIRQDLLNNTFNGNYQMVMKTKIKSTPFRKAGSVKVTVPAGTFNTIKVERNFGKDSGNRSTIFWLAPSLDYLPIKVAHNENGKKMLMELSKVN